MTENEKLIAVREHVDRALQTILDRSSAELTAMAVDQCRNSDPAEIDRVLKTIVRKLDFTEFMTDRSDAGWEAA